MSCGCAINSLFLSATYISFIPICLTPLFMRILRYLRKTRLTTSMSRNLKTSIVFHCSLPTNRRASVTLSHLFDSVYTIGCVSITGFNTSQNTPSGIWTSCFTFLKSYILSKIAQKSMGLSLNISRNILRLFLTKDAATFITSLFHSDMGSCTSSNLIDFLSEAGKKSASIWNGNLVSSLVGNVANKKPLSIKASGMATLT